jgi:methylmalonyl-CoA mutase N-terminal domain/subunit
VPNTIDPVGGSYEIEARTNEIEEGARKILQRIDALGGTLPAIESGLVQREIQESAFRTQRAIDSGESIVVGVTRFQTDEGPTIPTFAVNPEVESRQISRLRALRAGRDGAAWRSSLDAVRRAAEEDGNLVTPIIDAVNANATVGEISDTLRAVFGEHREATA